MKQSVAAAAQMKPKAVEQLPKKQKRQQQMLPQPQALGLDRPLDTLIRMSVAAIAVLRLSVLVLVVQLYPLYWMKKVD